MWLWVVLFLVCFLGLLAGCLYIPVHLVIDADTEKNRKVQFRIGWLFGLVKRDIRIGGRRRGRAASPWYADWKRLLTSRDEQRRARRMAADVLSRTKINELAVHMRFSTGNPLHSAIVMGIIASIRPLIRLPQQYTMEIQPAFSPVPFIEGRARLDASVKPARLAWPLTRFWWASRRGSSSRKKTAKRSDRTSMLPISPRTNETSPRVGREEPRGRMRDSR